MGFFDDVLTAPATDQIGTSAPQTAASAPSAPGGFFDDVLKQNAPPPVNPLAKAVEPITSYPSTYSQMNADARSQMSTGIDQIKEGLKYAASPTPEGATGSEGLIPLAKGIGNTALGALNYVASPINAALHTVVGKPIEESTGIPHQYTEFAASLALPGGGLTKAAQDTIDASKVAPTTKQIYDAASRGYNAIKDANVVIDPAHTATLADSIQSALKTAGYRDIPSTPGNGVFRIVDELRDPQSGKYIMGPDTTVAQASTPADIEAVRKALNVAGKDPANRDAVRIAQNAIDEFYTKLPESGAVVNGDAAGVANTVQDARANYAAAKKSQTIQGVDEAADLRSAASNSGANYDNSVRSRLATILLNPKLRRGFSPEELAQMESIVRGNPVANLSRRVGNFMGGGGGMGHMLTTMLGAHIGGPIGAGIASAAGPAFKAIENAAVASKVQKLDEMIRSAAPAQLDAATSARVKYAADKWAAAQTAAKASDTASLAKLEATSRGLAVVLQRNLGLDAQTMFNKLRDLSPAQADANGEQNR